MRKIKKVVLVTGITVLALAVILILCASPLTKYLVEKYDRKFLGREIKMDWAYVNPLTGYLHFDDLRLYEKESDSIFFSCSGISVNFDLKSLLSKTKEISSLTLTRPRGTVVKDREHFNFDDILKKFEPAKDSLREKETLQFNVLDVKMTTGEFFYRDVGIGVNYSINNVEIETEGYRWNVDTIQTKFSLAAGVGSGSMEGHSTIDIKKQNFSVDLKVKKFSLHLMEQYLKDLMNYGSLSAFLDSEIRAKGSFKDREEIEVTGHTRLSDLHFGKAPGDDYVSFRSLDIGIRKMSPKQLVYDYDSVIVVRPFFKYERYDSLDNVQTMFGKKGANIKAAEADNTEFNLAIELAKYLRDLTRNIVRGDYTADRLAIYDADLRYNDFSLNEKFSVGFSPFNFRADSIDKHRKRVKFQFRSGVKPYGKVNMDLSVNPKDSSDFDLHFAMLDVPASMFNPYLVRYTSFPLDRGIIEVKGDWHVRNGEINSRNHLAIVDPRIRNRIKNRNARWLPLRSIMWFVRERGNVIDYEVPIRGNLSDPRFKVRDVIVDVLQNIFVKPATAPYLAEVKNIETTIEKSLSLKWDPRAVRFSREQEDFIEGIIDFLKDNPDVVLTVEPEIYAQKEKESILFYEAKKKYYLLTSGMDKNSFSERDSIKVEKMSVKDPAFIHYLTKRTGKKLLFTVQEKCVALVSAGEVESKFRALKDERKRIFLSYFRGGLQQQIKMAKEKEVVPFNGFSFYGLSYKGDFPEKIMDAYEKLNDLDDRSPRVKFKMERRRNRREWRIREEEASVGSRR